MKKFVSLLIFFSFIGVAALAYADEAAAPEQKQSLKDYQGMKVFKEDVKEDEFLGS